LEETIKMRKEIFGGFLAVILAIFLFSSLAGSKEKGRVITPGDFFPEFFFPLALSREEIEYLGLPTGFLGFLKGETFSLKDIKADLIVLEYLNKYCFSCQLQAPVMNRVFTTVGKDARLKEQVKFLGVAAGNNQREVDSFKAEKKVPFPIVPDPKFLAYEAIGDPGATPFTLFLRKTDSGLVVARVRIGLTKEPEAIIKEISESLRVDWSLLVKQPKDLTLQEARAKKLSLGYNEGELLKKAQESMLGSRWKVLGVAKVTLPDDEEIYVGEIQAGSKKSYLFARLASRAPTCDICHATHFFFTFNEKGVIVNFLPLQVTKVDNKLWDAGEIEKMKRRLIGRSILQPVDFDPQVDAISMATMTSALIVDSVNKAKKLYDGLKSKGYIK